MKGLLLVICCVIGMSYVWAQPQKGVSKKESAKNANYDDKAPITTKASSLPLDRLAAQKRTLLIQADSQASTHPEETIDLLEQFFELSVKRRSTDPSRDQYAYFLLGKVYMELGRYSSAVDAFKQAETYFTEENTPRPPNSKGGSRLTLHRLDFLPSLGLAYQQAGKFPEALSYLEAYLALAQSENQIKHQVQAENLLGDLLAAQGQNQAALQHYQQALTLTALTNDSRGTFNSLDNIANNYSSINENQQARGSYKQATKVAVELGDDTLLAQTHEKMGELYRQDDLLDSAIYAESQSLAIRQAGSDTLGVIRQQNKISELLLTQQHVPQALDYLQGSLSLAQAVGDIETEAKVHELLATGYEQTQAVDQALYHYKQVRLLQDTLAQVQQQAFQQTLSKTENLALRDRKIATLLKEQALQDEKISMLQRQQTLQRRMLWGLGIGLVILAVAAFWVIRSNRARRRANQLLALKSLRSQMNPHFIFNSLNSINGFIAQHDDRTANKYLADFSKLMRTVLDHSQYDFVSLETEIAVLELYVKLEHFRFGDKFDYDITIDPVLNRELTEIPPMLVQPYIENAIWHGLRYKPEKGHLSINIAQRGDRLFVGIEDDGIGRRKSAELKTKNQKTHQSTGLKNTAQRVDIINELYQANLSVQISDIWPTQAHTGTRVELLMPLRIRTDQH